MDPSVMPSGALVTYYSIPALDATGGPILQRAGDIASAKFRVTRPSVLVSLLNPRIPRIYFAPGSSVSICSTEFAVLQPSPASHLLPEYLLLFVSSDQFTRSLASLVAGTTGSRQRVRPASLTELELDVPPLAEQRRIVDLIGAVDDTHEQAQKAVASAELAQRTVLLDLFSRGSVKHVPIVEVLADLIGGVWGSPPGEDEMDVAALGLTAFNAPTARVDREHTTPRSVNRERWSRRGLRADDIVLERSGGTNDRPVGRVIVAPSDMKDVIPTDFMRLLRVNPSRAVPRYVFWWLWARYQRGDTLAFQSMTTNIRNLRVTDYLSLPMPVPTRDAQCHVAATADDLAALVEESRGLVDAVARLRSALLADLLSGEHEIPASYDRFLDGAA